MASVLDSPYWNWFGGGGDTGAGNFYNNDPSGPGAYNRYTAADVLRQAQARNVAGGLPIDVTLPSVLIRSVVPVPGREGGPSGLMSIDTPVVIPQAPGSNSMLPLLALGVLAFLLLSKSK